MFAKAEVCSAQREVAVTIAPLHPRPGSLRATAEEIENATGLRVEIIGGTLMMSPTPRGKHAGVIYRLEEQIRPRLPRHLVAVEVASVEMPDDPDDYATLDLMVVPGQFPDLEMSQVGRLLRLKFPRSDMTI
jgi:hypothetical protein